MVTELDFLGKVFWDFEKWTKKMSKNQNPKKLCPKFSKLSALYVNETICSLFQKKSLHHVVQKSVLGFKLSLKK